MMIKKSISVTNKQDDWIREQVEMGHYGNDSEVIRELIRERQLLDQENRSKIHAIRAKLIEAENSGFSDQSADDILAEIKQELVRGE